VNVLCSEHARMSAGREFQTVEAATASATKVDNVEIPTANLEFSTMTRFKKYL